MRFALAVTALAAAVTAAPGANVTIASKLATMSVADASDQCGSNYQIYCCNELADKDKKPEDMMSVKPPGQTPKPGLLDGILGAVVGPDGLLSHLLGQCTRIDVAGKRRAAQEIPSLALTFPLVPGAADALSSQCRARAACCRNTPSVVSYSPNNKAAVISLTN